MHDYCFGRTLDTWSLQRQLMRGNFKDFRPTTTVKSISIGMTKEVWATLWCRHAATVRTTNTHGQEVTVVDLHQRKHVNFHSVISSMVFGCQLPPQNEFHRSTMLIKVKIEQSSDYIY